MPPVQCRICHKDFLVLRLGPDRRRSCPSCGASSVDDEALAREQLTRAAVSAREVMRKRPRFRATEPAVELRPDGPVSPAR
jgi:hypothetical protein